MSVREWWEGPPRDLAVAVTTALAAGLLMASWLRLPTDLYDQPGASSAMVLADDPGRAQWRAVIAELGGLGATFVIPAAFYGPLSPPTAYPVYDSAVNYDIDRLAGEIDAQMREAEWRNARWSEENERRRREDMLAAEAEAEAAARDRDYAYTEVYQPPRPAYRRYTSYHQDPPPADEFPDDAPPIVAAANW